MADLSTRRAKVKIKNSQKNQIKIGIQIMIWNEVSHKKKHLSAAFILKILENATIANLWQWHHISHLILVRVCATAIGQQNGIKFQHKLIVSNYQLKSIWYFFLRHFYKRGG